MAVNYSQYAALSRFFRGYLHQDAPLEHGSPVAAAQLFRKDADAGESAIVRSELDRLLSITARSPLQELANILEQLGCSWHFRTREEVEQLRDALK